MWRRMGLALLLSAALVLALPAFADSNARIVRLSYVDGSVEIDRGEGRGFQRAILNMPLVQGAQLATRDGATAEVEFEDGSTVRLAPDTNVVFRQLSLRDSGERVSSVDLSDGTAYFDLKNKKDDFTVSAEGRTITINKDSRFRVTRQGTDTRVAVFKGEAEVQCAQGQQRVKKNETYVAQNAGNEIIKGIDSGAYDNWAKERDQYQQTYASNHGYGYSPAYSYGWSDLNYFGNFYNYPGYGYLWRPYGVDPFWDPFADGAWMMYPGYGWMFVSAYPWGWTPYRYGSWLFVPGFGWAWQPGYWNRWYAVPVINQPPAGFVAPKPPTNGTGVVPVGKGPMKGVTDPRFNKWVTEASTPQPGMKNSEKHATVTPVASPTPAATTTATTSTSAPSGKATTTTGATSTTTVTPSTKTTGDQEPRATTPRPPAAKPDRPQPRAAPPASRPAPPPTASPKSMSGPREMSMPRAVPARTMSSGGASMRSGGRSRD